MFRMIAISIVAAGLGALAGFAVVDLLGFPGTQDAAVAGAIGGVVATWLVMRKTCGSSVAGGKPI